MTEATNNTNASRTLRVATRGSKLAQTQAGHMRDALIAVSYTHLTLPTIYSV